MGLPVKETGLVYLLAIHHLLQLQGGFLSCTCITEAPNKTHCGRLVRNCRGSVWDLCSCAQPLQRRARAHLCCSHTQPIIKPQSHKVLITFLPLLAGIHFDSCHIEQLLLQLSWGVMFYLSIHLQESREERKKMTRVHELELSDFVFIGQRRQQRENQPVANGMAFFKMLFRV